MNIRKMKKKGISPVIASIILIAITIAIAIAVAGWVFGIFGGVTTYAKVTIVAATWDVTPGNNITFCVTNTGTAPTSVVGARVTVGGVTTTLDVDPTPVPPDSSIVKIDPTEEPTPAPSVGQTYVLTVILADATQLIYEGEVV